MPSLQIRDMPNDRRRQVLARIRAEILLSALPLGFSPEQLIWDDRSR